MDKGDLKNLALLGLLSGMMVAASAPAALVAGSPEGEAEGSATEGHGCSGENGCKGVEDDQADEGEDEASSEGEVESGE